MGEREKRETWEVIYGDMKEERNVERTGKKKGRRTERKVARRALQ